MSVFHLTSKHLHHLAFEGPISYSEILFYRISTRPKRDLFTSWVIITSHLLIPTTVFHCLLGLCFSFSLLHYLINIQIPVSHILFLIKHHHILLFEFLTSSWSLSVSTRLFFSSASGSAFKRLSHTTVSPSQ